MMDLIRRPSTSLGLSTFEEFDRLFDNLWRSSGLPTNSFRLPSVDIYSEDDKHMVVEMQAPGFTEDDLSIDVRDDVLEIRGERKQREENDKKRNYFMRESHESFARRIVLPEGAHADDISAELENGVLKVVVPVERPEVKRISIASKDSGRKKLSSASS